MSFSFNFGGTPSGTSTTTASSTGGSSGFNFGSSSTAPTTSSTTAAPGGFSFGTTPSSTLSSTTTTPSNTFGGMSSSTGLGLGGTTTFGTNAGTAGSTATLQPQADYTNVTSKTIFSQLPQNTREHFEFFEKKKKQSRQKAEEMIKKQQNEAELQKLKRHTDILQRKVSSLNYNIDRERSNVTVLKRKMLEEMKWMEMAQSNFTKLQSSHYYIDNNYTSAYFAQMADKLEERMGELYKQIEDIANTLANIETTQFSSGQMLQDTLKAQQESFLISAAHVASLHEQVNNLRDAFMLREDVSEEFFNESPKKTTSDEFALFSQPAQGTGNNLPGLVSLTQPQQQQPQAGGGFFGAPSTQTTSTGGLGFGSAPSAGGFNFGTGSTPSNTGFNFGSSGTGTTAPSSSGFNFGTGTAAPSTGTSSGFNFGSGGSSTGTTGGGFNFGSTGTTGGGTTTGTTGGGFNFGSTDTSSGTTGGGFSFKF